MVHDSTLCVCVCVGACASVEQAQLTTDRRDAETRCTELTRQLEESQRDASHAHTTAQETRTALQEATAQVRD